MKNEGEVKTGEKNKFVFVICTYKKHREVKRMEEETIVHHSLWKTIEDMPARVVENGVLMGDREQIVIPKGDIIEFRYHYGIHFRTTKDEYYYVEESTLRKHCKLFGKVDQEVAWENKTGLSEILELGLFTTK